MNKKQDNAIRIAYWSNMDEGTDIVDDMIEHLEEHNLPATPQTAKKLWMILPEGDMLLSILWGISDTEVRENIWKWIGKNKENIRKQLEV